MVDLELTEKRYLLKYAQYETSNGEIIEVDPYYIDKEGEYVDEEDYFTIDGYPTMSDKQVVDLLNELSEENEQLKSFIKRLCNKNGEIWLLNGFIYRVNKVFDEEWWKND